MKSPASLAASLRDEVVELTVSLGSARELVASPRRPFSLRPWQGVRKRVYVTLCVWYKSTPYFLGRFFMPSSRGSTIVDRGYGSLRPLTVAIWPLPTHEDSKPVVQSGIKWNRVLPSGTECHDLRAEGLGQGQCRQPDRQHFPLL